MRSTASSSFDRGVQRVEDMMEQGSAFGRVEDAIEDAPVSLDYKAALWLLAWSLRDPALQRREARLTLAAVGRGGSLPERQRRWIPD